MKKTDNVKNCFVPADILLPDFKKVDGTKWATIACDQFTSEPEYWEAASDIAKDSPSTLNLIIPEVYLSETDARLAKVHKAMDEYLKSVLADHPDSMIYVERKQPDGRIRRGIVGMVDLECYDYKTGSSALIRATEGTVVSRIPPRVKVRRNAAIELPHIMMLIDDPDKTVIEPLADKISDFTEAYDFDLMLDGGHIKGYFIDDKAKKHIEDTLTHIASPEEMKRKYGNEDLPPLLFAVGDGNHSLATAKAAFEEIKARDGEAAMNSPARYALAEVVNVHDDALDFEPIYRVAFNVSDVLEFVESFDAFTCSLKGSEKLQTVKCLYGDTEEILNVVRPCHRLAVGTVQAFLDEYSDYDKNMEVDYVHGEESVRALSKKDRTVGFIFDGMTKDELFKTVIFEGALPRKTFSMGHARDKRYYLECRKIK